MQCSVPVTNVLVPSLRPPCLPDRPPGTSKVESELTLLLDDSDQPPGVDARKVARNRLKMACYALCQLADLIEKEVCKPNLDVTLVAGKVRPSLCGNKNLTLFSFA